MADWASMSRDVTDALHLAYQPAGVSLYGREDALPNGVGFSERSLKSYCQAVALAGKGEVLLLEADQMGCKLGTSVLGFEEDMEAYLDDGVLEKYGVGLFATEEASSDTIRKSTYLKAGATRAALIAPLSAFHHMPQVVVFTVDSEQAMWLLYALNYEKGGAMHLPQSGGALGGCADITALPLLEGAPNVTFLGLGCRLKSALDPSHLMLGAPGWRMEEIHRNVQAMAKPIAMLDKMNVEKKG